MIELQGKRPKILVVGDLMIDHYFWGQSERISPEAPVPVINISNQSKSLGGAGNVINNLSSLGAIVDIVSVIGQCQTSIELKDLLSEIGIDSRYLITQKGRITSKKTRVIAAQQQVARYDHESTEEIDKKSQDLILKIFKENISKYDIVLLSDYGKGVLTSNLTESIIEIANINNKKILVDPKGKDYLKYKNAYLLTPNKKEASEATNIKIIDEDTLTQALQTLKKQCHLKYSLITLSENGVAIFDTKLRMYPTLAREVFDVTGAGDTVLASLGFALSLNYTIDEAVKFANLASGVVVGKIGSAIATLDEIKKYELSLNKSLSVNNIKSFSEITSIIKKIKVKDKDKKIIFTNGCFDILHIGHVKYLEQAKSFGDVLIIGLNSDESIRKLKGNKRPINSEIDRAYILASMAIVDYVVIFEEDTPLDLIELIRPDILVKGGDYKEEDVVGKGIAKQIKIVDFIRGKSTTKTIEKIKRS